MRKIMTAAAVGLTLAGGLAATTVPAQAQGRWHGGGGWRGGGWRGGGWRGGGWRGSNWGWGVGAGVAGFALGSALASRPYYNDWGYYDYGTCARQVWDPYWGRWTVRYVC